MTHKALVATGAGPAEFAQLTDSDLPAGDVIVDVQYSSLNYKDGLAVTGKGKVIRSFPMVCGIDLAGVVASSDSDRWNPGDEVLITGFGLSESHPGGFTERQRVSADWLVRRPERFSLSETMAIGTAGLTAMLCVSELEQAGLCPESGGDVLVTGAAGGVGSVAIAILSSLGYSVTASTGRPESRDYLAGLGASGFIDRSELATDSTRPLDRERWAGVVDTVGSTTLATAIKQTRYRGAVASCGLAGGSDLPTTVLPFILRGVKLLGVDSVQCPMPVRTEAWARLAAHLPIDKLAETTAVRALDEVPQLAEEILAGNTRGRTVIRCTAN